jgi:sterol 24-C-methyltransferase
MTMSRTLLPTNFMRSRDGEENSDVLRTAERFRDRFDGDQASPEARKGEATVLVNEYYDLVTDFYEFGWGQSFHFAPRYSGETFYESLARHEYFLAARGHFKAGDRLIDMGCGVGGPLRNMVRFTNAHVTGINNNAYQIRRAKRYDVQHGLQDETSYIRTDFNTMPLASNSVDGGYAIEAICHSCDKVRTYKEVFRVLKPGARFVSYEWVLTDKYDHSNETHRQIRHQIELGNGLPSLDHASTMVAALREAGFIVEDSFDVIERMEDSAAKNVPWYEPLRGSWTSLMGLRATPIGRWFTSKMVKGMEWVRLAPKGSSHASAILEEAAVGLVRGGETRTFTPAYFFCARKPE